MKTTGKNFFFTILFSLMMVASYAQNEAGLRYNLMKNDYKGKNYDSAIKNLEWCLDNSPTLSKNVYLYGGNILKKKSKSITEADKPVLKALTDKLFKARFTNFPDLDPAKAHSDYAEMLSSFGGDKEVIFNEMEAAYKLDPTKMGVKSIAVYFSEVTKRNKDTNPKVVFDTYDETIEAMTVKLEDYSTKIEKLEAKKNGGETLLKDEERSLMNFKRNSKALGQVETLLDKTIEEISTCDYLVPLYEEQYGANQNDKLWLTRSINRMFKKECTDSPLYEKLIYKYQEVNPSPKASVLYAGLLMKKGEETKAVEFFEKAIDQETDPVQKAKNLMLVANIFKKKGQTSKSIAYAKKAIAAKPNYGRAYTHIARLYAKKANGCGSNEFEKRMVYVAAENYARKAANVDASISSVASRLAKSYGANKPKKKLVFNNDLGLKSGDSYTIKCLGETVRVP